jgi:hypothetical protein
MLVGVHGHARIRVVARGNAKGSGGQIPGVSTSITSAATSPYADRQSTAPLTTMMAASRHAPDAGGAGEAVRLGFDMHDAAPHAF